MTARPPFDPEIAQVLETRDDVVTALLPDGIDELRARAIRPSDAEITLDGLLELSEHTAPGPDGNDVGILLLRPRHADAAMPVLYHVHGGGLVVGTPYDDLPALAALAHETGLALASVDYRLAPGHRYPAAVEDVYAGVVWLVANAARLGLDRNRIIITGVSAGGGLAAAAALLARDRRAPELYAQMLLCPMLDDRNDSDSAVQMAGVGAWDRTANRTAWAAYLGDPHPDVPIYAAPARATDLSGLPPTFIDVGSAETFRSENIAYAQRLWADGGEADLHVWAGGPHGFDALAPSSHLAREARTTRAQWLLRILARGGGSRSAG